MFRQEVQKRFFSKKNLAPKFFFIILDRIIAYFTQKFKPCLPSMLNFHLLCTLPSIYLWIFSTMKLPKTIQAVVYIPDLKKFTLTSF